MLFATLVPKGTEQLNSGWAHLAQAETLIQKIITSPSGQPECAQETSGSLATCFISHMLCSSTKALPSAMFVVSLPATKLVSFDFPADKVSVKFQTKLVRII